MKWSKKIPEECGYYWYKDCGGYRPHIVVVEKRKDKNIFTMSNGLIACLGGVFFGAEGGLWGDRIKEPD